MQGAENEKTQNQKQTAEYKDFLNKQLENVKADISALAANNKLCAEKETLIKIAEDITELTNRQSD